MSRRKECCFRRQFCHRILEAERQCQEAYYEASREYERADKGAKLHEEAKTLERQIEEQLAVLREQHSKLEAEQEELKMQYQQIQADLAAKCQGLPLPSKEQAKERLAELEDKLHVLKQAYERTKAEEKEAMETVRRLEGQKKSSQEAVEELGREAGIRSEAWNQALKGAGLCGRGRIPGRKDAGRRNGAPGTEDSGIPRQGK